jgi:hypothetical protein
LSLENELSIEQVPSEQEGTTRYRVLMNSAPLSFSNAVERLRTDSGFRRLLTNTLRESPYIAFRWETPPYSDKTCEWDFEFVLVDYPSFARRKTDKLAYAEYFNSGNDPNCGIVAFSNLSGSSHLIVPSPITGSDVYGHLAAFVRNAPEEQVDALWRVVGTEMISRRSPKKIWLSTAGGGVAWLHVRIDPAPKYYSYVPYRVM